jgi:hypothetical protein
MKNIQSLVIGFGVGAVMSGGLFAFAQNKPAEQPKSSERKVKEADVPKAALETLKKMAAGAAFTEFAEEIEHGHKFFEGSWKGPHGNIDGLVTETGDMVELEESVPADQVPAAVKAEVEKSSGKDAKPTYEKKTLILYEAHYKKDGKTHEVIVTPDGRRMEEEKQDGDKDEDEDEKK